MMQAEIKGGPGLNTTWLDNKAFSGRRLTCINLSLTTLYMIANGNSPYSRTINQTKLVKNPPVYCLDLIVKSHEELMPALRKDLSKRFDLQAKVESIIKDVQVLRIADTVKFNLIKRNTSNKRTYYSSNGAIYQDAMSMSEFVEFLED